jgi:putative Holliday junction resolvase
VTGSELSTGHRDGAVLALDHGSRRIGVATCDPTRTVVRPLAVIDVAGSSDALTTIARMVEEHAIADVVVGLPLSLDGTRGPQADRAASFADRLRGVLSVPVHLHDERFTTRSAHQVGGEADLDSRAAAHLLEAWLAADRGGS